MALTIINEPIVCSFLEIYYKELRTDLNMSFVSKVEINSVLLDFVLASKPIFFKLYEAMIFHCEVMWVDSKSNFDSGLHTANTVIVHPLV